MKRRTGLTLRLLLGAVFVLSCLAMTAHAAMAAGEGCQASHTSVRSCGQTLSMDLGPVLPAVRVTVEPSPLGAVWVAIPADPGDRSQHQFAPSVPRSPPALAA